MTDPAHETQVATLLAELKAAQLKAARLGLVLTASLIGMATLDVQGDAARRDEVVKISETPDDQK